MPLVDSGPGFQNTERNAYLQRLARIGYATGGALLGGLDLPLESKVVHVAETLVGVHGNGLDSLSVPIKAAATIANIALGAVAGWRGAAYYQRHHQNSPQ